MPNNNEVSRDEFERLQNKVDKIEEEIIGLKTELLPKIEQLFGMTKNIETYIKLGTASQKETHLVCQATNERRVSALEKKVEGLEKSEAKRSGMMVIFGGIWSLVASILTAIIIKFVVK